MDINTALHFAANNQDYDKMQFLLDRGADPNSLDFDNDTPLLGALDDIDEEPAENLDCIELLLQHGADMFLSNERIDESFFSVVFQQVDDRCRRLETLTLAHFAIRVAVGLPMNDPILDIQIRYLMKQRVHYTVLEAQLDKLKKHQISRDLTMFTVISRTGMELFRLVNETDRKIVFDATNRYDEERKLHPYFISTLREHFRQLENIIECESKAMLVISESVKILEPYYLVVKKITGYFTILELLKFL